MPVVLGAVIAPAALFAAVSGDVRPVAERPAPQPVAAAVDLCCAELVASAPVAFSSEPAGLPGQAASRWRIVERQVPQLLPRGVAPEQGLQVRTIFAARAISAVFPEILNIGGVRPDALRWHPNGLAIDVMIPNPGSAEGIALGNNIVAYVLENAQRFGIQDAIWRGVYYTPEGTQRGGYGHFDHVHVTTTGGGYPSGREVYLR